ncbi:MAG: quinate 5-dehydrogenase [Armatimonadota bacterium]
MKHVVSVSLGSSKRDKKSCVEIMGESFEISRIGTDGDMQKFASLMKELDGKVDAIGLGGIDRYLWAESKRYTIKDADKLAKIATTTPVVDGSGVKNTLERMTIQYLQKEGIYRFDDKKALVVCAFDRFGMAQEIGKLAKEVIFGDFMFILGINLPMRSYKTVKLVGNIALPTFSKLPFKWLYPTGEKQNQRKPSHHKYYNWADCIAGDYLLINKTLPEVEKGLLKGKTIISNTITEEDSEELKNQGLHMLVTSSPCYDGRHYATNVYEGVLISLLGKKPEDITLQDYEELLKKIGWKPTITLLNPQNNININHKIESV